MTFPLAIMEFRFNFIETIIWTNLGGILGIYFFAYLSEKIIYLWNYYFRKEPPVKRRKKESGKPVFNRRNRRIVTIKNKYGLPGIALATPILLSIPVGVFIVVRYFGKKKYRFLYMVGGNFVWSLIYTLFYGYSFEVFQQLTAGL